MSVVGADRDTATIAVDRDWPTTVANDASPPAEFEILLHSQTRPDGLAYDAGSTWLSWVAAADTDSGIAQYQLLIDGVPAPGWTADANNHGCDGSFMFDLSAIPGVHEYSMRATDYAGNTTTSNSVTLLGDEVAPAFIEPLSIALREVPLVRKDGRREHYVAPVALHWHVEDDAQGVGLAAMGWYWHENDSERRSIDVTTDATKAVYRGLSVRNNTQRYGIEAQDLVQNSATQTATIVGRLIPDKRFHADSTWRVVSAKSAVGGERLGSVRRGSKLQIILHQGAYGIVAKTGPKQGSITISADGAVVDTVDLKAARPNPRQIVWTTPPSGLPGSTLQIATTSRMPVNLDDLIRLVAI